MWQCNCFHVYTAVKYIFHFTLLWIQYILAYILCSYYVSGAAYTTILTNQHWWQTSFPFNISMHVNAFRQTNFIDIRTVFAYSYIFYKAIDHYINWQSFEMNLQCMMLCEVVALIRNLYNLYKIYTRLVIWFCQHKVTIWCLIRVNHFLLHLLHCGISKSLFVIAPAQYLLSF